MSKPLFFAVTVLIAVSAVGLQAAAQHPAPAPAASTTSAPPGSAMRGRDIYLKNSCHACHGTVGQGGGGAGPAIAAFKRPYPSYVRQMRYPRGSMPAYGPGLLTDQAVADIYAYIAALPGPDGSLLAILED